MNYGFIKIASAIPQVRVADCQFNTKQIESLIIQAEGKGVEIISFPELALTSYTCQDLFNQQLLLDSAEMALIELLNFTHSLDIISIVGVPVAYNGSLINCAAVIQKGRILGLVPKTFLANKGEFYEKRWFMGADELTEGCVRICGQQVPIQKETLFRTPSCTFGIEIGTDLWAPIPPSSKMSLQGAEVIFNLSADSESIGKYNYLKALISQQSSRNLGAYVYTSCGYGESTQDMVYGSKGLIYENGKLLAEAERFSMKEQMVITEIDIDRLRADRRTNPIFDSSAAMLKHLTPKIIETERNVEKDFTLTRSISKYPFIPEEALMNATCKEIFDIQCEGLAKRIKHTHAETIVVGISGGLDSTLALLVCVRTFDLLGMNRRGVIGITMPGFGTTDRTYTNAVNLMKMLGITIREIDIQAACRQHFEDIGHNIEQHDVTYENSQARERTQILMDAANQTNGFVVGTGDLSELALGWATYNGDHMSMYGVNADIPKTLIKHLVSWYAKNINEENTEIILNDIIGTPISPELIPADEEGNIRQKTEDLVGPYELHDFFLYYTLRWGFRPSKIYFLAKRAFNGDYNDEIIKNWLTVFCKRFIQQQFKRSCLPDGPKIGSCSLSPRSGWRMPSDASAEAWMNECERL